MREKYSEWEDQYASHAGVVAFVIDGIYYATQCFEEALSVLKSANMKKSGVSVPFTVIFDFSGKLVLRIEKS